MLSEISFGLRNKTTDSGKARRQLVNDAIVIFNDPEAYAKYRAEWELRHSGRAGTEPDSGPTAVKPERGPEPQPQSAAPGLRVLSLLARVATTYLEGKASQELPQVAGRWRDSSGGWLTIQQNGAAITGVLTDAWGNQVSQGQGAIKGRAITYMAGSLNGQVGEAKLTVSPDGNTIQGQMTFSMSGMRMGTTRVLLVRA